MAFTRILTASKYLPEKVVSNQALIDQYGFPQPLSWFDAVGIKERRFAGESESAISMAVAAVRKLSEQLPEDYRSVDMVIMVTSNHEITVPGAAAVVAQRAGLQPGLTFDLSAACTGFAVALDVANQYIRNGSQRILIVASALASRFLHFGPEGEHHQLAGIFGDGAGAVYLEASDKPGVEGSARGALPEYWQDVVCYRDPVEAQNSPQGVLLYQGVEGIAKAFAVLPHEVAQRALDEAEVEMADVQWLVSHQPRLDMVRVLARQLGISSERHYINFDMYGNTSPASIPICLADLIESDRLQRGDQMLIVGMGAGFLSCAHVVRF